MSNVKSYSRIAKGTYMYIYRQSRDEGKKLKNLNT